MFAFALTRIPGMLPPNFSAAYALTFCAGVFFPGRAAWAFSLGTIVITDFFLNCYYQFFIGVDAFQPAQLINYIGFASILFLGKMFRGQTSWIKLLSGGILGALLFYLLTNTASWFFNPFRNPEYTKSFSGWLIALTRGTAGWPTTLEFFRNTLLSGGMFTGLFVGAKYLTEPQPAQKEEAESEEDQPTPEVEEERS